MSTETPIYRRPVELLQNLIRFDTTNPPGNERPCIQYIRDVLAESEVESTFFAKDDNRPNLVARLKGRGDAPPLLLYGHVDVVTTEDQNWTHPPFAAEIADGYIWGRGALDMKGAVAMMLSSFLRAKDDDLPLPGDVIFLALSDEEDLGTYGAKFMTEEHTDLFEGVRYALGECGGFSMYLRGKKFYPIMVGEKQACWMKAILRGPGGHGSIPMRGGAAAKLGRMLSILDKKRLPVHIMPVVRDMVKVISREMPFPQGVALKQLLNPMMTDRIIDLLGEQGQVFDPLFHNTVNATVFQGGHKINVVPSEISVNLDGRLLPGFQPEDMFRELHDLLGDDIEFEIVSYDPGPSGSDMGLFDTLAGILKEADPEGIPMPLLLGAVTDGRFFARIGIQTYGFIPMQLPEDFDFNVTIHAADERVPVEAMEFGTQAIYKALQRFGA
jgi:acetylornithine deacetylase/succinyl-diaminopimelate desuccinylase-like protein